MGKNDIVWKKIFDDKQVVNEVATNGMFVIEAEEIREKYKREPRLMTKFDHSKDLPKIFTDNNLCILPISRGEYVISNFKAYADLPDIDGGVSKYSIPAYIQSLNPNSLFSEAVALNCAEACGILEDFLEDSELQSTVSGRMKSDSFTFNIQSDTGDKTINVNNSQIEIDASYEGLNNLSLFEAKKALADDFLVRQLYYPYRTWKDRVTKEVKTVYFVYSNGIFYLYQYQFQDPNNYSSSMLIKSKKYSIINGISISDIKDILNKVIIEPEQKIPFPQADSIERVINLVELLYSSDLNNEDITSTYEFVPRQTNYYTAAAKYLGLVADSGRDEKTSLSEIGRRIMSEGLENRQLLITQQMLKHKPFNDCLKLMLENGETPTTEEIVRVMKNSNLYNVGSDSTFIRRASTIKHWLKWVISICDKE